jgi:hypothetical protein
MPAGNLKLKAPGECKCRSLRRQRAPW